MIKVSIRHLLLVTNLKNLVEHFNVLYIFYIFHVSKYEAPKRTLSFSIQNLALIPIVMVSDDGEGGPD